MPEPTSTELKVLVARQREELKTINEVGRLLRLTFDPNEMIRLVASYLRQTFPVTLCAVLLTERRKLHLVRFTPITQADLNAAIRQILEATGKLLHQTVPEKELTPLVVDQAGSGGPSAGAPVGYLRSHAFVPLTFNNQSVGMLGVFSGQANALKQEDLHALEIVADQLHAALRNALLVEQLKETDSMKNDLLSVISHELRIPLTVIREGVSLLQDGALGPTSTEQTDFLKTVSQNIERFRQLLDKVLLASQVITGKISCALAPTELETVFSELEATFRPVAQAKGITLQINSPSTAISWVMDKHRLLQALSHLMENGIQATDSGGLVSLQGSVSDSEFEIQVADTGKGIPEEAIPQLFNRFGSVGGIHDRKTGGVGLGLFIAQGLITAHGGTIRVESAVGKGTRFTVRLPKK